MNKLQIISKNQYETIEIAKKIASKLTNNTIIVLEGDLGSGKTKFVEGFLSFYNMENEISSPTFTIVNEYSNNNISIFHFDVYRLHDANEFMALGGEEYFEHGHCLIEWGSIISNVLPEDYIEIKFEKDSNCLDTRTLNISFHGNVSTFNI